MRVAKKRGEKESPGSQPKAMYCMSGEILKGGRKTCSSTFSNWPHASAGCQSFEVATHGIQDDMQRSEDRRGNQAHLKHCMANKHIMTHQQSTGSH